MRHKNRKKVCSLFALMVSAVAAVAIGDSAVDSYHLLKVIPVSGNETHWDYLAADSAGRRIYISYGPHVLVWNADSNEQVGTIDAAPGYVHGIAIASDLGRGFITNAEAASVTIFNLKTMAVLGEVKVTGKNPDAIVYDPATHRVFSFNAGSSNATAIDAKEGTVVGTIDLGGRSEFAAADGKGHLFVDLVDKGIVLQIDSRKLTAGERWSPESCQTPTTMAIDVKNDRLFVGCRKDPILVVLDASDGHTITKLPIGAITDAAAFDPGTHLVFASNTDGTLTVIHQQSANKYSVLENVKTEVQARTMALDLKTHKIFLSRSDRGTPEPGNPFGTVIPGTFRILILGM
jgi:DNA-binding beta-propeller fold protein YncE